MLCLSGNFSDALSSFEKALGNLRKCVPINQTVLAKTYDNMATALNGLQRYREAVNYAKQAADTARYALGSSHSETKRYQKHLDELRRKL